MSDRKPIESQAFLYHLTCLDNLESILTSGLMSRSALRGRFVDVADGEIINGRQAYNLQSMVPFHFFAKNPFDGRVLKSHTKKDFCIITVSRELAKRLNWKIIPQHPLATGKIVELLDYVPGFEKIDWELMNKREYANAACKSVCMAECLSPNIVMPSNFAWIFVKDETCKQRVEGLLATKKLHIVVKVNPTML